MEISDNLVKGAEVLAAITTAVGVVVAAWQLRAQKLLERTQFEDLLTQRYRDLMRELPIDVHFGKTTSEEVHPEALPGLWAYVDLCNEQVFLRMKGRIRKDTWVDWAEGIRNNLQRPMFRRAWEAIKDAAPDSFNELRRLQSESFATDPRRWKQAVTTTNKQIES